MVERNPNQKTRIKNKTHSYDKVKDKLKCKKIYVYQNGIHIKTLNYYL